MVLGKAWLFALCLAGAQAVSRKVGRDRRDPHPSPAAPTAPAPLLVLRLAYSGSSWFTQMISEQNDTYITREANWLMGGSNRRTVEAMTAQGITSYILRAMARPSGDVLHPNELQFINYSELDDEEIEASEFEEGPATSLLFQRQHSTMMRRTNNPEVLACLTAFGQSCHVRHIGLTMDPVGTGLNAHRAEVFRALSQQHPNLPVVIYRRSNIIKHAVASGGIDPQDDRPELQVNMQPMEFLNKIRQSQEHDRILLESASFFSKTKVVMYEQLMLDAPGTMQDVLTFLEIPFDKSYIRQIAGRGGKKTPEDLRQLFSNFDELYKALYKLSPCLAEQMRSTTVAVFPKPCPAI